jgi:lipoprotein NlpI
MRGAFPLLILGAAALTLSSFAQAQFRNHADICITGTGKFDLDISFCSLAIKSGLHSQLNQATLFAHRGRARLELGDHHGAVQDFGAALELNPGSAMAHNERGRAYHKTGDNAQAVNAYNKAIKLFPHFGAAFRNRGTVKIFQGKLQDALADLDTAIASVNYDPASRILRGIAHYLSGNFGAAIPDLSAAMELGYPYPEAVLWIYLAERRLGRDGKAALIENAADMTGADWPRPLIKAYLGETTAQAALEAGKHENSTIQRRRKTQAYFYLGQLALLNNDIVNARKKFDKTIELSFFDAIEYAGAMLELGRQPH